ncbi:response regulator [Gryllotalpicola protaetiae]|nr:response regulator [Gryllotalpicola protaetiae]
MVRTVVNDIRHASTLTLSRYGRIAYIDGRSPALCAIHDDDHVSIRVAVVDDDDGFRRVASLLLTSRGMHVVVSSSSATDALELIRSLRPEAALIDVEMPGMGGVELAECLHRLPRPPRVVLTSAADQALSEQRLASAGAQAFIRKEELQRADLATLFGLS